MIAAARNSSEKLGIVGRSAFFGEAVFRPMQRDSCHGLLVGAVGMLTSLLAIQPAQGQWVGPSFTHEQATSGQAAYEAGCASCHGDVLEGGELGPPLRGRLFLQQWGGKSVAGLFAQIVATKPGTAPGTLSESEYADLMAYILQLNGVRPSAGALPSDLQALSALVVPSYGPTASGGLPGGVLLPPPPDPSPNPLNDITPVTDAMLADPPPGDWLTWRRTNDAFGYSPLDEINSDNVGDLRVAWSWSLPPGSAEVAPLVHDGVMFVARPRRHCPGAGCGDGRHALAVLSLGSGRQISQREAQHRPGRGHGVSADFRRANGCPGCRNGQRCLGSADQ